MRRLEIQNMRFFFLSVYVALISTGCLKQEGLVLLSLMSSVIDIFNNGSQRSYVTNT